MSERCLFLFRLISSLKLLQANLHRHVGEFTEIYINTYSLCIFSIDNDIYPIPISYRKAHWMVYRFFVVYRQKQNTCHRTLKDFLSSAHWKEIRG